MKKEWNCLIDRVVANGGVGTPRDARACGVSETAWHRRTQDEGWARPYRTVRVAPWAPTSPITDLRAALAACRCRAVAAGWTAAWLFGLVEVPTRWELLVPHEARAPSLPTRKVRVGRARWLTAQDVRVVDGVTCLQPEASMVSLAAVPAGRLRATMIDMAQAGLTTADRALARLATVGPVEGRDDLERILTELGGRRPESWFHDIVLSELQHLGYPVEVQPRDVATPDGRGLLVDIPIGPFSVGVEPAGDRFHRSARARRNDRRRAGQAAGTGWVLVPVDWRDWHDRRAWVLETIDAAILQQLERGAGSPQELPPHLVHVWQRRVQ